MTVHKSLTWLAVSASDEVGAHWWQNPGCDSEGRLPTCLYLGPGEARARSYLLYDDGSARSTWTAADNATSASATANLELTTCGHTASCGGRRGDSNGSTVSSHLEVVQLDAAGQPCTVTKSGDLTSFIGNVPHHYSIQYQLPNVPILSTCGSRQFYVRIYLQWVSGNAIKIDGFRNETEPYSYTNAFIVASFYASSTVRVPPVIGLREDAARTAISAAQLNVIGVSNVIDLAAPGTVIGQNPSAGTVEPVNSGVELTVSLGAATVPNVVFLDEFAAFGLIHDAGLTVGKITLVDNCVDPGTVIKQSLTPGRVVAPGTSMNISVSECITGDPR